MLNDEQRLSFERRYIPEPNTGCWLWIGYINDDGYAYFSLGGKRVRAHRLSDEYLGGSTDAVLVRANAYLRTVQGAEIESYFHRNVTGTSSLAISDVCGDETKLATIMKATAATISATWMTSE